MAAPLEMPIGFFRLGQRESPVDDRGQPVHRDRPVHGLEIVAAAER
jgi:hypothetical protein